MSTTMPIRVKRLSTGYWHARGNGPCEWAQWSVTGALTEDAFFAQASDRFRKVLRLQWAREGAPK